MNFMKKSECSKDLLKKKWSELATSFTNTIKEFLLPWVEMTGKEISRYQSSLFVYFFKFNI